MSPAMRSEKNVASPTRKKYRASTRGAIDEAASGKRGVPDHMSAGPRPPPLLTDHRGYEACERQHGADAGQSERAHDGQTIPAPRRIVVIAVEQEGVRRVANPAARRFDDREAQVSRAVLDAKEIARQSAVWRQDDDSARMRELLSRIVPHVTKARRSR